jgi:uncharacterized membrane protein
MVFFFLGLAALAKFFPPSKQSQVYGFRTQKSLSSPENWLKANKLFGSLLFNYSVINTIPVIVLFILFGGHPFVILYTAFSYSIILVIAAIRTDKKL